MDSSSSISIQDDRIGVTALLFDQGQVQRVIDRLSAIKGLLPENAPRSNKTGADSANNEDHEEE
jgi:hypothetical protein